MATPANLIALASAVQASIAAQNPIKPDSIQLLAEIQDAIAASSSGNSLPNGTLINGVANFYSVTKPTLRVDGSSLVVGDLWYKFDNNTQFYWNGTYWLTTQAFAKSEYLANFGASTYYQFMAPTLRNDWSGLFFERLDISGYSYSDWNASNYSTIKIGHYSAGSSLRGYSPDFVINGFGGTANFEGFQKTFMLNQFFFCGIGGTQQTTTYSFSLLEVTKTGLASNPIAVATLVIRGVAL